MRASYCETPATVYGAVVWASMNTAHPPPVSPSVWKVIETVSGMRVMVEVVGSLPSMPSRKNVGLGPLTLLARVPAVLPVMRRTMPVEKRTDQPAHSCS